MPAFSYVAVDAEGRTRRGVVEADAPRQARAGLRSAGLVPVELAPIDPEAAARQQFHPTVQGVEMKMGPVE